MWPKTSSNLDISSIGEAVQVVTLVMLLDWLYYIELCLNTTILNNVQQSKADYKQKLLSQVHLGDVM